MRLLSILFSTSRLRVVLTLICGVLSGMSSAALLAVINRALTQPDTRALGELLLPFVGLILAALLTRISSQLLLNRLQQAILRDLRLRLTRHLLNTSLRQLEQAGAHRLLSSLVQDLLSISTGVIHLPDVFINIATVVGVLGYMASLSWVMFAAMVGFIAVGIFTYSVPASIGFRLQHKAREKNSLLLKRFLALIDGAKELRLNKSRRQDFYTSEVVRLTDQVHAETVRSDDFVAVAASWGTFLYMVVIGLMLFLMPQLSLVTVPMLIGYVLVVLYLQQPLNGLMASIPFLGRATIGITHVENLGMKLTPERAADVAELPAPKSIDRIELAGVTHTYRRENEDETFTLGPIDLSLHPGEVLFLVGGNGSGKTTLAKILTGLYLPEGGEIRVDGKTVPADQRDQYRQHFSAVFFDFYLFDRMLGLASPVLGEEAQGYLAKLHLDRKVQLKGDQLSTLELSQGQRKRLALLVAYLEDRPVYVFDEWAADQDPTFKEIFYKQIVPDLKRRGKAVLVISHDDRYFGLADRIVRLESGQLVTEPVRASA